MVKDLTGRQEIVLANTSADIGIDIVLDCRSESNGDAHKTKACVKDRLKGLKYIENIIKELPESHPIKIPDYQVDAAISSAARDSAKFNLQTIIDMSKKDLSDYTKRHKYARKWTAQG